MQIEAYTNINAEKWVENLTAMEWDESVDMWLQQFSMYTKNNEKDFHSTVRKWILALCALFCNEMVCATMYPATE